MILDSKYYPALQSFFQVVRTGDEQQIVSATRHGDGEQLSGARLCLFLSAACLFGLCREALRGRRAAWMHAVVNAPLPAYDEKTDAVLLYSETNVTVVSADKIKTQVREAYKILRPNGRDHGPCAFTSILRGKLRACTVGAFPRKAKTTKSKTKMRWKCLPNDRGQRADPGRKIQILNIPAPDPGNIVGYEYEVEEQPFFLQDIMDFPDADPVRESHYSLQLPPGWEYKASWLNHPEVKPSPGGQQFVAVDALAM